MPSIVTNSPVVPTNTNVVTSYSDTGGSGGAGYNNAYYAAMQKKMQAQLAAQRQAELERLRKMEEDRQKQLEAQRLARIDAFQRAQTKKQVVTQQIMRDLEMGKIDPVSFSQLNPDIKKIVPGQTANIPFIAKAANAAGNAVGEAGKGIDALLDMERKQFSGPIDLIRRLTGKEDDVSAQEVSGVRPPGFSGTNLTDRNKPMSEMDRIRADRQQTLPNKREKMELYGGERTFGQQYLPQADYKPNYTDAFTGVSGDFWNPTGSENGFYEPLSGYGVYVAVVREKDKFGVPTGNVFGIEYNAAQGKYSPPRPLDYFNMRTDLFTNPENQPKSIPRTWAIYMQQDGYLSGENVIKQMEGLGYEYNFETDSWELSLYGGSYSGGYGYDDSGYSYGYGGGEGGSSDDKENEQRPEGFTPVNWRIATG